MSEEEKKAIELLTKFYNKYKNIIDIVQNNIVQNDVKQTSDEFTNETRYYTPEGEIYKTIIKTYKCPKNYISKDKIKGKLLEPIREEANKINKINKKFFEKDKGFEVKGALLQELGVIEGMILELLKEE